MLTNSAESVKSSLSKLLYRASFRRSDQYSFHHPVGGNE
jgi:hypothetical protein